MWAKGVRNIHTPYIYLKTWGSRFATWQWLVPSVWLAIRLVVISTAVLRLGFTLHVSFFRVLCVFRAFSFPFSGLIWHPLCQLYWFAVLSLVDRLSVSRQCKRSMTSTIIAITSLCQFGKLRRMWKTRRNAPAVKSRTENTIGKCLFLVGLVRMFQSSCCACLSSRTYFMTVDCAVSFFATHVLRSIMCQLDLSWRTKKVSLFTAFTAVLPAHLYSVWLVVSLRSAQWWCSPCYSLCVLLSMFSLCPCTHKQNNPHPPACMRTVHQVLCACAVSVEITASRTRTKSTAQ